MVGVVEDGAGHAGGVLHPTQVGDGANVGRLARENKYLFCILIAQIEHVSLPDFIPEDDLLRNALGLYFPRLGEVLPR